LSSDYNILVLGAPEIAAAAEPGQFVMVKAGTGHDPLLRRPFPYSKCFETRAGRRRPSRS
jgi:NAD(P)H-flavin reductase